MWSSGTGPEVIIKFSCSAQLRLKFILLINVKNANNCSHFNILFYEQNKLPDFEVHYIYNEPEFSTNFDYFSIMSS